MKKTTKVNWHSLCLELCSQAVEMRRLQTKYYSGKSKHVLQEAIKAERSFDKLLHRIANDYFNADANQASFNFNSKVFPGL